MSTIQISTRLDEKVAKVLKGYCKSKGLVINRFITDCILDKLEELLDVSEISKLKKQPTRKFEDFLAELQYSK